MATGECRLTPEGNGELPRKVAVIKKKRFSCTFCGKGFSKNKEREIHENVHTGEGGFECDVCCKRFATAYRLRTHQVSHTKERPFKCDQCPKSFRLRQNLAEHLVVHGKEVPYTCRICGKGFSHSSRLRNHEHKHTGEKPFSCDLCPKAFRRHASLIVHKRVHSGEKPYECLLCGCNFANPTKFAAHKKFHEGQEKLHKCDECSASFAFPSKLAEHKRIHTGGKPYQCCFCGKTARSGKSLQRHKKLVHKCECNGLETVCSKCAKCVLGEPSAVWIKEEISSESECFLEESVDRIKKEQLESTHDEFGMNLDSEMLYQDQSIEMSNESWSGFQFVSSSSDVNIPDQVSVKAESEGLLGIEEEGVVKDQN